MSAACSHESLRKDPTKMKPLRFLSSPNNADSPKITNRFRLNRLPVVDVERQTKISITNQMESNVLLEDFHQKKGDDLLEDFHQTKDDGDDLLEDFPNKTDDPSSSSFVSVAKEDNENSTSEAPNCKHDSMKYITKSPIEDDELRKELRKESVYSTDVTKVGVRDAKEDNENSTSEAPNGKHDSMKHITKSPIENDELRKELRKESVFSTDVTKVGVRDFTQKNIAERENETKMRGDRSDDSAFGKENLGNAEGFKMNEMHAPALSNTVSAPVLTRQKLEKDVAAAKQFEECDLKSPFTFSMSSQKNEDFLPKMEANSSQFYAGSNLKSSKILESFSRVEESRPNVAAGLDSQDSFESNLKMSRNARCDPHAQGVGTKYINDNTMNGGFFPKENSKNVCEPTNELLDDAKSKFPDTNFRRSMTVLGILSTKAKSDTSQYNAKFSLKSSQNARSQHSRFKDRYPNIAAGINALDRISTCDNSVTGQKIFNQTTAQPEIDSGFKVAQNISPTLFPQKKVKCADSGVLREGIDRYVDSKMPKKSATARTAKRLSKNLADIDVLREGIDRNIVDSKIPEPRIRTARRHSMGEMTKISSFAAKFELRRKSLEKYEISKIVSDCDQRNAEWDNMPSTTNHTFSNAEYNFLSNDARVDQNIFPGNFKRDK